MVAIPRPKMVPNVKEVIKKVAMKEAGNKATTVEVHIRVSSLNLAATIQPLGKDKVADKHHISIMERSKKAQYDKTLKEITNKLQPINKTKKIKATQLGSKAGHLSIDIENKSPLDLIGLRLSWKKLAQKRMDGESGRPPDPNRTNGNPQTF